MKPDQNNLVRDARAAAQGRKASERLANHCPQLIHQAIQDDIAHRRQTFTNLRRQPTT